jgi:hypothetical protein
MDDQEKDKEQKRLPEWEKRNFAINDHMKQVCEIGIVATKAEIANLKRKLRKLQYGS